jgi:hypothetical protein
MVSALPLTVIPLIVFNIVAFAFGGSVWGAELFGLPMVSGVTWVVTYGDVMIAAGIVVLFFEVMRSGQTSSVTVLNHILSTVLLLLFVVEFVVVAQAANSVFFVLVLLALFDVVAGFSITIRTASRDVSLEETIRREPR